MPFRTLHHGCGPLCAGPTQGTTPCGRAEGASFDAQEHPREWPVKRSHEHPTKRRTHPIQTQGRGQSGGISWGSKGIGVEMKGKVSGFGISRLCQSCGRLSAYTLSCSPSNRKLRFKVLDSWRKSPPLTRFRHENRNKVDLFWATVMGINGGSRVRHRGEVLKPCRDDAHVPPCSCNCTLTFVSSYNNLFFCPTPFFNRSCSEAVLVMITGPVWQYLSVDSHTCNASLARDRTAHRLHEGPLGGRAVGLMVSSHGCNSRPY